MLPRAVSIIALKSFALQSRAHDTLAVCSLSMNQGLPTTGITLSRDAIFITWCRLQIISPQTEADKSYPPFLAVCEH